MPRKGGKRKKTRTHEQGPPPGAAVADEEKEVEKKVPKSIVARANKVSQPIAELIHDLRRLMSPYTATSLKERRYNRMKDYAAVAGHLGVSHLLFVSQTKLNVILRVARVPDGPTLHFRINQYSLCKHIKASQRRPYDSQAAYLTAPLVVLNNFSQAEDSHIKLMRVTFQHMFPTININTIRLNECRRVVLFHLLEDGAVEMRHYGIRANPVGINKAVKRILHAKLPNLHTLEDISEFIEGQGAGLGGGMTSESEAEDELTKVVLPGKFMGKGNSTAQRSAMKLTELGPRLTLELYKVEQGVNEGDVLYHKFVHKTPEEAVELKRKVEKSKKLKEQRRNEQEANVKRKRDAIEEKTKAKAEKRRRKLEDQPTADDDHHDDDDDDDDGIGSGEEELVISDVEED